jgi:UDPglucose--hexose-1-phosphate uridylyltransferase
MSELRHDPINRRWVIVALERAMRPGEFSFEPAIPDTDEEPCELCPGRETETPPEIAAVRETGAKDSTGWVVRVVPNKRPVLAIEGNPDRSAVGHFDRMRGIGAHELVLETPQHRVRPADMSLLQLSAALEMSRARIADLCRDTRFKHVLLHKNYGAISGSTIHHPMQQLIAIPITPIRIATQLESARRHFQLKERCLHCDIVSQELDSETRLVHVDDDYMSFCPYASRFPYELQVYPRRHEHQFTNLDERGVERLAAHMLEVFRRLQTVLGDVPFNWMLINAPNTGGGVRRPGYWTTLPYDFHWHIEILPRLTPQAGFEWGTGLYINPAPPEDAAAFLRDAG